MKTISNSILFLLLFTGFAVTAQSSDQQEINPRDPAFRKQFEKFDFKGKFSAQVLRDNSNNYYLVDFSQLRDKYEKVYFLSLAFKEGKVVNLDSDLTHDKIIFSSNSRYTIDDINQLFAELKDKVIKNSDSLTAGQKEQWLRENDKYK